MKAGGARRILIADDDPISLAVLAAVLEENGYVGVPAADGLEAWELLQRPDAPRLAMLDRIMPGLDGLELVRRVRAQPTDFPPYLIMVTARGDKTDLVAGLDAGANDYLTKPFDSDELRARIAVGRRMVEMQGELYGKVEALRESEERFRTERMRLANVVEGAQAGAWECNFQTGETIVNATWAQMLGYALAELLPLTLEAWLSHLHPDDLGPARDRLAQHARGASEFFEHEARMRHQAGHWIWVHGKGKIISRVADGSPGWMYGTHVDITARKGAEIQMIRHAELETLLATLSMQFISIPPDQAEPLIREALAKIGMRIEVDRVHVWNYTPDLVACSNTFEWCAEGVEPQIENLQNLPVSLIPWWQAQMLNLRNIVVSEVARLPVEAAKEKEMLEAQGIQSVLVVPLSWGGRLKGFMGFDSVRTQKNWTEEDVAPLEVLAGIIYNAIKHKDAELRLRELNTSLERRVEERTRELHVMQSQLYANEKMASIGQLAAGVAHEINNPVSFVATNFASLEQSMTGFSTLLSAYREVLAAGAGAVLTADALAQLGDLEKRLAIDFLLKDMPKLFAESREGIRRITAIVDSMRGFARRELSDSFVPYDLNAGIRNTLVITRDAYKYNAEIVLELGAVPLVACVAGQVNQVLLNLIVNAAQALGKPESRAGKKGTIRIRTGISGNSVFCEVADNGPGIPPDVAPHIFDPFFTTKAPGEGTGLGLSISHDIVVRKHGGTLKFVPAAGGGACLMLTLPITREVEIIQEGAAHE